jgi:hypothetical protein
MQYGDSFKVVSYDMLIVALCLRNTCIVFEELPTSIGNLTVANAVLLGKA